MNDQCTVLTLIAVMLSASAGAVPPSLKLILEVERPRPIDYGVLPDSEIRLPLRVSVHKVGTIASEDHCVEGEPRGKINCTFVHDWFAGAGDYLVSIQTESAPAQGQWARVLTLPDRVTSVSIGGAVSLRYVKSGLSVTQVTVMAGAGVDVSLSSKSIGVVADASLLPSDVIRFHLQNNSRLPIRVRAASGVPVGRLYEARESGPSLVRHGVDRCFELWAAFEVELRPGAWLEIDEQLEGAPLLPGRYSFSAYYVSPDSAVEVNGESTVFEAVYFFELR
ncbi:MAG: hypothetical protein Q8O67_30955 [Deltaproteobacteria bacterium]|nr:hypothetical protein [Deltaproteobacteria bacterium]